MFENDTIAAVATAPGQAALGIIRISGPYSRAILERLFRPVSDKPGFSFTPRMLHHGWIYGAPCAGPGSLPRRLERIDEVLVVFMPGPATATGEDVAEIHCHGGPAILRAILDAVLASGARTARPGEFTYRGFCNGKYDLPQAEAIAEMIAAPSRDGLRLAGARLAGAMGKRIHTLRSTLDALRAEVTLAVDFAEDDTSDFDAPALRTRLQDFLQEAADLLAGYKRSRLWREGALAVLAGQVNMGKSSLLNALLGRERAIVSPVPGTTRDFIEESIDLEGLPLRLVDTAGLRASPAEADSVELEGLRLGRDLVDQADVILLLFDAGRGLGSQDHKFIERYREKILLVPNKIDALPEEQRRFLLANASLLGLPQAAVSAKLGTGLEALASRLRELLMRRAELEGGIGASDTTPNLRQSRLLARAIEEGEALLDDLDASVPPDLLGLRLDSMAAFLEEIIGVSTPDDILGTIFSKFCIGK